MQRVEAIIRPERLQVVKAALEELDHGGMTLTEVRGHGVQRWVPSPFPFLSLPLSSLPSLLPSFSPRGWVTR